MCDGYAAWAGFSLNSAYSLQGAVRSMLCTFCCRCVCMLQNRGCCLLVCPHVQSRHGLLVAPATRASKVCLTSTTWLGAVGEPLPSSQTPLPAAAHESSHTLTVSRIACSSHGNCTCPACFAAPCLAVCVVPCATGLPVTSCSAVLLPSPCSSWPPTPVPACTSYP